MLCFIILRKVKMHLKCKKDLYSVWRRCCDCLNMSKVVCKVPAGYFSLDDATQSARRVEVDRDRIETLIGNNEHYTIREIANKLKISKSIKLLVKMKNVFYFMRKLNGPFGQSHRYIELGNISKIISKIPGCRRKNRYLKQENSLAMRTPNNEHPMNNKVQKLRRKKGGDRKLKESLEYDIPIFLHSTSTFKVLC